MPTGDTIHISFAPCIGFVAAYVPMIHFFPSDLIGLGLALILGGYILLLPGFSLGWALNLLDFRTQSNETRCQSSVIFGIGLSSILLYLADRLVSIYAMWLLLGVASVTGTFLLVKHRSFPRWKNISRSAKIAVIGWLIVGSFSLLDLTAQAKLYPTTAIVDHSYRSQVIASIADSKHLPPTSFFFYPGHPVDFHYHYFLFLFGALIVQMAGGLVSAHIALIAVTLWTGLALIALVGAFVTFFLRSEDRQRACRIAWFFLIVGGLDILPFAFNLVLRWNAGNPQLISVPDLEWWNHYADLFGWYDTTIWASHHLAGLIASLSGGLVLWHSRSSSHRQQSASAVGAALAFASAGGLSVLVTMVFAVFFFIVVIELLLNAPKRAIPLAASGIGAITLLIPFFLEIHATGASTSSLPFGFIIRSFYPVTAILLHLNVQSRYVFNLSYVLSLPVNYLFEMGAFFLFGAAWLWSRRYQTSRDLVRDHLMIGLFAVSSILTAFIYFGTVNDFGCRGYLPAQFVLLLWTTEFLSRPHQPALFHRHPVCICLAVLLVLLGIATNLGNFIVMRTRIISAERAHSVSEIWPKTTVPEEQAFQLRAGYVWLRNHTPKNAIVQQNPEPYLWLEKKQYSERMAAVQGEEKDSRSGGTQDEFKRTLEIARSLFAQGAERSRMIRACQSLKVDYLVVQESDPAWSDRRSYVWTESPIFQASLVRIFRCGP